jgi:hypothetical protein
MAVNPPVLVEKENAAIDMNISMVVESLSEILHASVEEILPQFLQSRTCRILYDRESKLWWDGPSAIVDLYLEEIGKYRQST